MPAHNAVVGAAVAGAIGVAAYTKYQQAQITREEREATEDTLAGVHTLSSAVAHHTAAATHPTPERPRGASPGSQSQRSARTINPAHYICTALAPLYLAVLHS